MNLEKICIIGSIITTLVLIILITIIAIIPKKSDIKGYSRIIKTREEEIKKQAIIIYPYHRVSLLTNAEKRFYIKLKTITNKYGYEILAKIRLADLINVNKDITSSEWNKYFGKIKAKHIDFAIHRNMNIICLIELDDYTHQKKERIERDIFVDTVLKQNGYTIIHSYGNTNEIERILLTTSAE